MGFSDFFRHIMNIFECIQIRGSLICVLHVNQSEDFSDFLCLWVEHLSHNFFFSNFNFALLLELNVPVVDNNVRDLSVSQKMLLCKWFYQLFYKLPSSYIINHLILFPLYFYSLSRLNFFGACFSWVSHFFTFFFFVRNSVGVVITVFKVNFTF